MTRWKRTIRCAKTRKRCSIRSRLSTRVKFWSSGRAAHGCRWMVGSSGACRCRSRCWFRPAASRRRQPGQNGKLQNEVRTRLARQVELRFKSGSDVAVVTLPPAVLVIDSAPDAQSAEAVKRKPDRAQSGKFRDGAAQRVETYAKDIANCLTDVHLFA